MLAPAFSSSSSIFNSCADKIENKAFQKRGRKDGNDAERLQLKGCEEKQKLFVVFEEKEKREALDRINYSKSKQILVPVLYRG